MMSKNILLNSASGRQARLGNPTELSSPGFSAGTKYLQVPNSSNSETKYMQNLDTVLTQNNDTTSLSYKNPSIKENQSPPDKNEYVSVPAVDIYITKSFKSLMRKRQQMQKKVQRYIKSAGILKKMNARDPATFKKRDNNLIYSHLREIKNFRKYMRGVKMRALQVLTKEGAKDPALLTEEEKQLIENSELDIAVYEKAMKCKVNVAPLNYAKKAIARHKPCANINLVRVQLPPPIIDEETTLKLLKAQNKHLLAQDWLIVKAEADCNTEGRNLWIRVHSESLRLLYYSHLKIKFGLNQVPVFIEYNNIGNQNSKY